MFEPHRLARGTGLDFYPQDSIINQVLPMGVRAHLQACPVQQDINRRAFDASILVDVTPYAILFLTLFTTLRFNNHRDISNLRHVSIVRFPKHPDVRVIVFFPKTFSTFFHTLGNPYLIIRLQEVLVITRGAGLERATSAAFSQHARFTRLALCNSLFLRVHPIEFIDSTVTGYLHHIFVGGGNNCGLGCVLTHGI